MIIYGILLIITPKGRCVFCFHGIDEEKGVACVFLSFSFLVACQSRNPFIINHDTILNDVYVS